jgi:hypothetical protein
MRIVALRNVNDVVCDVSSSFNTVAVMAAAEKPFPGLKNSSDMLPVTQPTIPSNRSLTSLVYQQDTILDHGFQSHPQVPVSLQLCGIPQ